MPASPLGPASATPGPAGASILGPTPSPGAKATALAKVRQATKLLETVVPELGADSEEGKEVLSVLMKLTKMAPPSEAASGIDATALKDLQRRAQQMAPLLQMQGGGGPQAQPGAGTQPPLGGM